MSLSRRDNLLQMGAVSVLLASGFGTRAFAGKVGQGLPIWVEKVDALTAMRRGETVTEAQWRDGLKALFNQVEFQDVLKALDFERLKSVTTFAELGVSTARVDFGAGDIKNLTFYPKLFAVGPGRAIIPHGHANMISAHFILGGRFNLRQYDQLARDENSMTVRQRFEGIIRAGELSSIGEEMGNVHWFIAEEPSYTFDMIVTGLDTDDQKPYDIFNLDMDGAERDGDVLRVPRLGVEEALAKYG